MPDRPPLRWSIVVALLLLFAPAVSAAAEDGGEGSELAAVRGELEEVRQRLAELEAQLASLAAPTAETPAIEPPPSPPPVVADAEPMAAEDSDEVAVPRSRSAAFFPSRGWLEGMYYGIPGLDVGLHAFMDLEYIDPGPDGSRGGKSTFDTHHANIFLETRIRPNLLAHAEFEFEHSGDTVEVDQAYLAWAVNDALTLEAGRFYAPFGIERFVWYSPTNLLVSRPEPMRSIIPGNFYANGLMAAGVVGPADGQKFGYEVALSNGLGSEAAISRRSSRQNRDNNDDKALTGRVSWLPVPQLEVGASYHGQRYDDTDDLDFTAVGLDLATRWRGWQLRSEWIDAEVERGAGIADLGQSGWYTQVGYTFTWFRDLFPDLTLVTRYDDVDLDDSVVGNDDRQFWSLGLNASVYDHFRFKLEYRLAEEDGPALDDDTFYGQVVVDF